MVYNKADIVDIKDGIVSLSGVVPGENNALDLGLVNGCAFIKIGKVSQIKRNIVPALFKELDALGKAVSREFFVLRYEGDFYAVVTQNKVIDTELKGEGGVFVEIDKVGGADIPSSADTVGIGLFFCRSQLNAGIALLLVFGVYRKGGFICGGVAPAFGIITGGNRNRFLRLGCFFLGRSSG